MTTRHKYALALAALAVGSALLAPLAGQDGPRLNRVIEQIERYEAAFTGEHWQFIDMEHGPYLPCSTGSRTVWPT